MHFTRKLALFLFITLVGCSSPNASVPTSEPSATPESAPATPALIATAMPHSDQPQRPFPQHTTYTAGTIKPSKPAQDQLDAAVLDAYGRWKKDYLRSDVSGSTPRGIAISEGQGYGMLLAAFMAGADPDAQQIFDGLYAFFRDHPSAGSTDMMAWKQVEGCANVDPRTYSATDGDMDIAYALLLADKQWGSAGALNYRQAALKVIAALREKVVNPRTHTLMLGDWVTPNDGKYGPSTRTSDFMIEHLRTFATVTGDEEWMRVADTSYTIITKLQNEYSPKVGLLPDFVQDVDTTARPADPRFLENDTDGQYAYNACRVPLRIGVDYLLTGDPRALAALQPLNAWIKAKTYGNPHSIYGGYKLDGSAAVSYYEQAFAAPFGVSAMVSNDNQRWLNAIWVELDNKQTKSYYSDSLRMLAMVAISGNWWSPRS